MTTRKDLNISVNFHRNKTLVDALFELIANALDANALSRVEDDPVKLVGNQLVIENSSVEGILLKNFVIGSSSISPTGQKIGQHGLGLKDAISILYRLGHTVSIESRNVIYSFFIEIGDFEIETIHVEKSDAKEDIGKVRVIINNINTTEKINNNDVKSAREKFMFFRKAELDSIHSSHNLEVYKTSDKLVDYVYVDGVMKNVNFKNLNCIYNFKGVNGKDRRLIDSNHNITDLKKTDMYKILRQWIDSKTSTFFLPKSYEFIICGGSTPVQQTINSYSQPKSAPLPVVPSLTQYYPHTPAPTHLSPPVSSPSSSLVYHEIQPIKQPRNDTFENSLINLLLHCLQKQDAPLYTLTYETIYIESMATELKNAIQTMKSISVEKIENSGSFAKHTAVPGYADVDLVVFLNDFNVEDCKSRVLEAHFHRELASKGVQFMCGASDILTCKYKEVDFDIVLTSSRSPHPRYQNFARASQSVVDLIRTVGSKDSWVYDVIRACKYWIQRHLYAIKRVKSFAIELIVLNEFVGHRKSFESLETSEKRCSLFAKFLQFLTNSSSVVEFLDEEQQNIFNEQEEWKQSALTEFAKYADQKFLSLCQHESIRLVD